MQRAHSHVQTLIEFALGLGEWPWISHQSTVCVAYTYRRALGTLVTDWLHTCETQSVLWLRYAREEQALFIQGE